MKLFQSTLIIAGAMLSFGSAIAADMPRLAPPPMMMAAAPPAQDYSGWYLRGDVGVSVNNNANITSVPETAGWTTTSKSFFDTTSSHTIGAGVGYQVNSWFRVDATLEYRGGAQIRGRATDTQGCCFSSTNYSTSLSSTVGLLNGYVDLGTWAGLTPFIGAGIGFANNRMGTVAMNGVGGCTGAGGAGCTVPTMGHMNGATKNNLAWALMAGVAYDVTPNAKLEMGYRYMNLGGMNSSTSYTDGCPCGGTVAVTPLSGEKLTSHDFRIGMRWMLQPTTYAQAPQPLMRRN
jgi:opacity protein-like surface antigen